MAAQPFDPDKMELRDAPEAIAEGVGSIYETGYFSATGSTLLYRAHIERSYQLTWFDRQGNATGKAGDPGEISNPRVSPDGTGDLRTDSRSWPSRAFITSGNPRGHSAWLASSVVRQTD
jgi:hypothetical protein